MDNKEINKSKLAIWLDTSIYIVYTDSVLETLVPIYYKGWSDIDISRNNQYPF